VSKTFGKANFMSKRSLLVLICVVCAFTGSGCATIVAGGPDAVFISSTPTGATVTIDGAQVGVTPMTAMVRRNSQMVTFSKAGYQDISLPVQKDFNAWVLGNLLIPYGFFIGLIVDGVAGNFSKVSGNLMVTLPKTESGSSQGQNGPDSIAAWLERMRKYAQLAQADPPDRK